MKFHLQSQINIAACISPWHLDNCSEWNGARPYFGNNYCGWWLDIAVMQSGR